MERDKKINLHQYASPRVSKKYLLRFILYLVLLGAVGLLYFKLRPTEKPPVQKQEYLEIENVTIELDNTL